ncbi:MAG: hypothetical protein ACRDPM_22755 [Solirubrobacteraceae bacterium]
MLSEGHLRFPDEAVGLRGLEPALNTHDSTGRDVPGLDREHGIVSFSQSGLDMADEQLAAGVPTPDVGEEPLEAFDGRIAANGEIVECETDVDQAQVRSTQEADELCGANLADAVAPGPVGLVDGRRGEQPIRS